MTRKDTLPLAPPSSNNIVHSFQCPLHTSSSSLSLPLYYDYRYSVNAYDSKGLTPLHISCINGNKRCVKLCLRNAASINDKSLLEGLTPLDYASKYSHHELSDYLKTKGAVPSSRLR